MLTAVSLHLYCLVADDCLNELNNFFSTAFVRVLWLGHICHSTLVHGLNVCMYVLHLKLVYFSYRFPKALLYFNTILSPTMQTSNYK